MTERPFLTHDLGTRNDPKMVALELADFVIGKAIWWDLLEMLWEQGGTLPTDYKMLAYVLRYPTEEQVRHLVEDFDLFKVFESEDGRIFTNESAKERIARKVDATEQRREAGIASGRARRGTPVQTPVEQPLNDRSNAVQTPVEQLNQIKSNKIKSNHQESAHADVRTREDDEDFLIGKFFFRNFKDPDYEAKRCLENYAGTQVKSWESVVKKWTPEDDRPRFDDKRILDWTRKLWAIIGTSATPHEAAEFLRHIDNVTIDKGRNELTIRMVGNDWGLAIESTVDINPPLQEGFEKIKVTKVRGT